MKKIVLDTNVLVSALLNPSGKPAIILNSVLNNENIIIYDARIIDEYRRVLSSDKFGFSNSSIIILINFINMSGINAIPSFTNIQFSDESDRKFYEVAIGGEADFLVTGNLRHFPRREWIVSPKVFLEDGE